MTDISITVANVIPGANAVRENGTAGETITAGMAVYKSSSIKKWLKADSNSATPEARQATAIALCGSSLDQPITVQTKGDITIGGTLVAGVAYYLSDTPGGICPIADVGSGEYVCLLGVSKSTAVLTLNVMFPNVAL